MNAEAAAAVLGGIVVAVIGGGAWFSVTSAVRGPRWALARTPLLAWAGGALILAGLVIWALGALGWLGPAVLYMGAMLLVTGRLLRRMLQRMEAVGGLDEIGPGVRGVVIRRAKLGLLVGGMAFLAGGILVDGTLSLIMLGIAVALGLNWVGLQVFASRA